MTQLRLGPDLTFPPELAGRRTAVFGISGSGKSNTATVLVEQLLHAGEQVVLIDPKGEGWGLLVVVVVGLGFLAYGTFCATTFTRRRLESP